MTIDFSTHANRNIVFVFSILTRFLCLFFVRQQRLLQRPTSTRGPIIMKSTTTKAPIVSTTKTAPKLASTSSFDDLLNSFQTIPTTTRRPQLTTFSDVDDIAFLKGLVSRIFNTFQSSIFNFPPSLLHFDRMFSVKLPLNRL